MWHGEFFWALGNVMHIHDVLMIWRGLCMADHSAHCRLSGYPGVVSGERAAGKRVRSYIQRTIMALFFPSHFEFKKC